MLPPHLVRRQNILLLQNTHIPTQPSLLNPRLQILNTPNRQPRLKVRLKSQQHQRHPLLPDAQLPQFLLAEVDHSLLSKDECFKYSQRLSSSLVLHPTCVCDNPLLTLPKGTNSWWLSQLQSNSDVDNVFSELALVSLNVNPIHVVSALMSHRRSSKSRAYGALVISTVLPRTIILCIFRF